MALHYWRSCLGWLLCAELANAVAPHAQTSGGKVFGVQLPANSGGVAVDQFLGIPFASADRFQAPVDFRGAYPKGAIKADMWGDACLQVGTYPAPTYGSDDCLKANVWRPQGTPPDAGLPVMVFIYGGSNQFGEAEPYNMSALAAFHDVVCVSFNYRTGPLGWMAFQEDLDAKVSTGNWGILDIQSALRWVQREVAVFGGDPKRVAIHGQSSGGGLVELQYVAPASAGLFRGAISESGSLGAMSIEESLQSTAAVAKAVGCHGSHLKKCIAGASAKSLVGQTYSGRWGPSVDGVTFPLQPQEMLEKGMINNVTVVIGAQTNDSNLFLFQSYTKQGLAQPNDHPDGGLTPLSPRKYRASVLASVGARHFKKAMQLYPPYRWNHIMNVHQLGNIEADQMHCQNRQRASLLNHFHPGRAFTYRFDYWYMSNSACTAVPNYHLPYLGAAHQDEVTFVLGQPNFMEDGSCCGKWGLTAETCPHLPSCEACYAPKLFGEEGYKGYFDHKEWAFARTVGTFWTNVAASGDPNKRREDAANSDAPAWPKFDNGGRITHNIVLNASLPQGYASEPTPHGRPEICDFWDQVAASKKTVAEASEQVFV
eukprot:gnl/MRDRNA2_/MRDRNA2_96211_c0_seq1.p1 gnl/MRDRNA2_/MRDRNA2_96211_c0~~gnl/MRDRNA2_/MRDRNA2_96211_c0_seq1.p1  ORF type:complete len:597 (-),score=102.44 gnl/MRDRNA2_/MRDRNA2_96211_c0_seq1:186-1976(-)